MTSIKFLALTLAGVATVSAALGEVKTREVEYKDDGTVLQGFLAHDDSSKEKRPGVLVIHEWWGHNQHSRNQAIRLAKAGYVGFAIDMYGKGKVTTHPKDAESFMKSVLENPQVMQARFKAGLALLRKQPEVDPKKIAVIGYCFGGTVAIDMALKGEDIAAIAAFHAGLGMVTPPKKAPESAAKILILNGAADPMNPKEKVDSFMDSLKAAGASAELVSYPGVKHGFTNPDASKAGMDALAYDAKADEASWQKMLEFFSRNNVGGAAAGGAGDETEDDDEE